MKHFKTFLFLVVLSLAAINTHAQATVSSLMIEDENRNAVKMEINQPVEIATEAMELRMKRAGISGNNHKGVTTYKEVILAEIAPEKVDIYTKVEKGANNSSVVFMAVSRGYDNFTNAAADSTINENIKNFLESFAKDADNHSTDIVIASQMDDLGKSEKAYENLLDEQKSLEKKRDDVESRLKEIQIELNTKQSEIAKMKSEIEASKLKKGN